MNIKKIEAHFKQETYLICLKGMLDLKLSDDALYESKKENLVEGTIAFSVIFQELLMQGYSREFEMESDREGT